MRFLLAPDCAAEKRFVHKRILVAEFDNIEAFTRSLQATRRAPDQLGCPFPPPRRFHSSERSLSYSHIAESWVGRIVRLGGVVVRVRLVRKGVSVDAALRSFITEKLGSTLRRLAHRVRWVRILVEDTNGPRGGLDKRCVVSVGGDAFETRVVDVRDVALPAAVAGALQLAARSVVRAIERGRDGSFKRPYGHASATGGRNPIRNPAN
jgi:putative sigma-54 modulation protein